MKGEAPMIREDEVLLMLDKWRSEGTPLHVVARFPDCTLGFDCRIVGFAATSIGFDFLGESGMCEIFISGFSFDYAEPRDLDSATVANRTYASGLMGLRRPVGSLAIMEIAK
jgi:hypothetical protein